MSAHVDESLWEYALGLLPAAEREEVERHLRECPACAVELRAAEETLAQVAMDLPPVAPSPQVLERLMAATESRYEGLVARLCGMWDLGAERVRELIEWMKTASWEPSGIPGVDVLHLEPGPKAAHADAGFVRFAPGLPFPFHDHIGDELQLIMDGMMIDDKGVEFRVGDMMWKPVGTSHSFVIGPEGCLIALSLVGGIVINGVKYAVKN
jgi:anti-sigma factor ChrR (cupin superfamily)